MSGIPQEQPLEFANEATPVLDAATAAASTAAFHAPHRRARTAGQGLRLISRAVAVTDALCVVGALTIAETVFDKEPLWNPRFLMVAALAPLIWVAVFHGFGLYGVQHLSASEEFRRTISATTLGVLMIFVGSLWWKEALSRSLIAWTLLFALLFEFTGRRLWRWHIRHQKRIGRLALRTLLVGTNEEASRLGRLLEPSVRGFIPVGHVATSEFPSTPDGLPVLGHISDLEVLLREHAIECVFVASTAVSPMDVARVSRACRRASLQMRISAQLPEILTSRLSVQTIDEELVLSVRPAGLTGTQEILKRSFDLLVATALLILTFPIIALAAVAIAVTSGRPVLFRQERVTKEGRIFTMYKFRTMLRESEWVRGDRVIDLAKPFFKLRDDPRMTRVGRLLRSLSLDELPQLWNVLRGDMSMVGPRPLAANQVATEPELLAPRHEVKAGLTGWWQVHGRNDVEIERALRMDVFYIENWSLSLDFYILLKTIGALIARRGAY